MNRSSTLSFRSSLAVLALGVSAGLTGCMVVPLDPQPYRTASAAPTPVLVPAAPSSQLLQVRLYPLNAEANQAGALQAVVMDGMNGRGSFTLAYRGHNLSGEATRVGPEYPGFGALISATLGEHQRQVSGRRGIANAAGAGTNAQCEYVLTAPGQGVGACLFSDGARYQMHFGL
ncbi:hypothetical protein [Inhella crocodyli]|uniref:Lipoprotein n=1 Tax=Inhella crocodyli TaxID=2499851 RepID=A0A437LTW5_9BURK|nr:hypothetical protein [Inhella crocodyli]RVT88828.1 hypothetical protein EOD73_07630 [Inhella crocodyli]